jgi:hypothetical protein
MRNKFNLLVLDTETHFKSIYNNLIFDIAWCWGDIRNPTAPKIERRFFVKEFLTQEHWEHTFLENGIRKYWYRDTRAIETQRHSHDMPSMVKSWDYICGVLSTDISMVDGVGSYNWGFDSKAIDNTNRNLNHEGITSSWDFKPFCLQDMYVNKIINANYFKFINSLDADEIKNYLSKSGKNLGYSAEVMARYVNEYTDYIESHTALDDSKIEFELARIFCNRHFAEFKKDFLGNPKGVSWKSVKDKLSSAEKMRRREERGNQTS